MRTREEIERNIAGFGSPQFRFPLELELLLDIRDLLSVKSKSRRLLLEEIPMTDRERELLNSLEEKE